jgi:ABC-type transport system involved in multi-copper enzyme maturation permease subunit
MNVLTLGLNVFRRHRRKRAFWIVMAVFLLLIVANYIIAGVQKDTVVGSDVADFIWGNSLTVPVLCIMLSIAFAQNTVSYEINKSTIHLILARPVSPEECMGGMYLGSLTSIMVPYLVLSLVSFAGMAAVTGSHLVEALVAVVMFAIPVALMTVLVTFFSSWMPGSFAGLTGFALFIFSFFSANIDSVAGRVNMAYRIPLRFINLFSLRFDAFFDQVRSVILGYGVAWRPLVWEMGYAIIIVALGVYLFRFRKV